MNAALKLIPAALQRLDGSRTRRTYLGASDVAAIMGMSPWATPADVYYRKRGEDDKAKVDPVRQKIFRRGKRLEPIVIEMLKEELGIEVTKVSTDAEPNRYVDSEFDFLAAEIDFEWRVREEDRQRFPWARNLEVGSIQNGEIKTVSPFQAKEWGEMDTDEVPIYYAFQSMQGLGITHRDVCMYGTLFGADNLVTYGLLADPECIAAMRARAVAFWQEHVLAGVVPPPQTIEDLQRMYLRATLSTLTATPDIAEFVRQLHEVKDQKKAAEDRETELEFQIQNALGEHEALVDAKGKPIATWKNSQHSGLNQARLKEERPEIHAEYYESRPMRRFYLTGRRSRK